VTAMTAVSTPEAPSSAPPKEVIVTPLEAMRVNPIGARAFLDETVSCAPQAVETVYEVGVWMRWGAPFQTSRIRFMRMMLVWLVVAVIEPDMVGIELGASTSISDVNICLPVMEAFIDMHKSDVGLKLSEMMFAKFRRPDFDSGAGWYAKDATMSGVLVSKA